MKLPKPWSTHTPQPVSPEHLQQIREGLGMSYRDRIQSKLAARFPVNVELKYSTEGTHARADIYDNKTIASEEINKELLDLFYQHRGRLLITGAPGAGKTTLLLQLAFQLLSRHEHEIPIIINIATWRPRFASVEEWLRELLPQMGFYKGLALQMIAEKRVLPLFDGLDELAADFRAGCLEAIGNYGRLQNAQYVICSRIVEYAETIDAPVYCQIMVKPLELWQIMTGLSKSPDPESAGILDAIEMDPLLARAITVPFYFNTVQLLFAGGKAWGEFGFDSDTVEERQAEIVNFFVNEVTSQFPNYSSDQVKKYLAFLADRMTWKGMVEFELVGLQYDWVELGMLQKVIAKILAVLIDYFINFLAYSLVFTFLFGALFGVIGGLLSGMVDGVIFGLSIGLFYLVNRIFSNMSTQIKTRDIVHWSSNIYKMAFYKNLKLSLLFGGFGGLVLVIMVEISDRISINALEVIKGGALAGVSFGLMIGLVSGLIEGFVGQLRNNNFLLRTNSPYQRFKASVWALHFSIIQHHHLQQLLSKKGSLPKNIVTFLRHTSTQNITESDGGSWRFRHRILQEYFAKHWKEKYEDEAEREWKAEQENLNSSISNKNPEQR